MLRTTRTLYCKMLKLSVDGNISSGKSTLVSRLAESFPLLNDSTSNVEIIPEPLEKWCNLKGHNLLNMFYKDPVNNNFIFQHYVQLTRLMDTVRRMNLHDGNDSKCQFGQWPTVRIMERSLQNNRHCFIELARKMGNLHDAQYAVLAEWHTWLEQNLDLNLDFIIYLRTSPEVVYSRMISRGREEESTVPLEYLTALHETYEDWLIRHQQPNEENPNNGRRQEVIVVNANQGKDEVFSQAFSLLTERLTKIMSEKFLCSNGSNAQHHPCSVK